MSKPRGLPVAAFLIILILSPLSGFAAETAADATRTADIKPELLENLSWREIGPAVMGGRVTDLAVLESNPATFYAATATGGLWKTTNHGTTWQPLFEDEEVSSIGDVTLAPSNPNIIWVGTGEANNRQSSPWGKGVYKSVDGGRSWELTGLEETRHVARILIHPSNPNIVYVAAPGHLWGPNPERGVFRTLDGGKTWRKVLYIDDDTGATDIAMHPSDPDTILAATYQRRRTSYGFNGGGLGSGIYRTNDGGENWVRLSDGLPNVQLGRISLDFYKGDSNLVYASVQADQDGTGVYRSNNRGNSWQKLGSTNPRPMYFSQIRVDPNDPKRVYLPGVQLHISDDGGLNFETTARSVHSDHHALWIDPGNSNHLIMAGDGGINVSMDRAQTWRSIMNIAIGQFYEIGLDMQDPYFVCGGLQDNGTWCGPSRTHDRRGIRNADWFNIVGGDGFYARIDPNDPNIMYGESQTGNLVRINRTTGETQAIRPLARSDSAARDRHPRQPGRRGRRGGGPSYRFNWNSPMFVSQHDSSILYYGGNGLLRSQDRGHTWEEISPDLTKKIDRNELDIMGVSGSEILRSRNDGIRYFGTLTTITESPSNGEILYVGTDDGNVQMTRDGGKTWNDLTPRFPGVPDRTPVSRVLASGAEEGRGYVTFDGHENDDYRPYVFVTEDFGRSWQSITSGLPETSVNVIVEHHRNPNLLFVGNEMGVFFSADQGQSWLRLKNNLPTVPVDDIQIHPRENDLVIGTHGRSVWIMDDITPLEELASADSDAAHVFSVRRATVANTYSPQGWTGDGEYAASNPSGGAQIRYFVPSEVATRIESQQQEATPARGARQGRRGGGRFGGGGRAGRPGQAGPGRAGQRMQAQGAQAAITISDAQGNVMRRLSGPAQAGIQNVSWDLRMDPPYVPDPNAPAPTGRRGRFGGGAPSGPRVLPGSYKVQVELDGSTSETMLEVRGDPRVPISQADRVARQEALMRIYNISKPAYEAGNALRRIEQQVSGVEELLQASSSASESLREQVAALRQEISSIQQGPAARAQAGGRLQGGIERFTSRPTVDQLYQIEEAANATVEVVEKVNQLITKQLPDVYKALNREGIHPDPGQPITPPSKGG